MDEKLQIRVSGDASLPTLVYLPGLHGDWTLITGLRLALAGRTRFVEITYPRSLEWSISQYAHAIEQALVVHDITHGWLIGESFGSQFAWELAGRGAQTGSQFAIDGIILAGGFVKHPWKRGPRLLRWIGEKTSARQYARELSFYVWYARFRHRRKPAVLTSLAEFARRRTESDRQAMRARLVLLDEYDPRPIARATHLPVYYLAGLVDPLVPWGLVRQWLRKNCPGYRAGKTFWLADHNVLATSPLRSADLIMRWIAQHPTTRPRS